MIAAKGLTRRFAACAALVAFALLSFVSAPARAEEIQFVDSTITVTNCTVSYDSEAGDLILVFTDTSPSGVSFSIAGAPRMGRYLLVGGGGAGGTPIKSGKAYGQGGGGGAGDFVEATDVDFPIGTYSITVGAGGAAAADSSAKVDGNDGGPSTLSNSDLGTITAAGGGGGGARAVGHNGGSGGGGSASGTTATNPGAKNGGTAAGSGIGNAGGRGGHLKYAGGGGGAGGAGTATTSSSSGAGGAGKASDITGTSLFYAAGGGGGQSQNTTVAQGGSGIGGDGAINEQDSAIPGQDGTGSAAAAAVPPPAMAPPVARVATAWSSCVSSCPRWRRQ